MLPAPNLVRISIQFCAWWALHFQRAMEMRAPLHRPASSLGRAGGQRRRRQKVDPFDRTLRRECGSHLEIRPADKPGHGPPESIPSPRAMRVTRILVRMRVGRGFVRSAGGPS